MTRSATRDKKYVTVFGLGYVGLPLVGSCLARGYLVSGFDINFERVQGIISGISPVDDVSDQELAEWTSSGFRPTSNPEDLRPANVYVICVPTPLTPAGGPDLSAVEAAARTIRDLLGEEAPLTDQVPLVVLESTTYPGTTEEVVKPILEESGLIAGIDFHLAFSPERIDPGNQHWTFANTPKVLGGLTAECADAAEGFYSEITERVVRTKGLKEAEMAKLLENTYRHVNIALVNELWRLCSELDIDIWDVIDAAETKPYGFHAFRPGPGVGGHCIPIDPNYLSHQIKAKLGRPFRFVELAQEINASMPDFVIGQAQKALNREGRSVNGSLIMILGVTYKANVGDVRESPALPLIDGLLRLGAHVEFADPFVSQVVTASGVIKRTESPISTIQRADLTIVVQHHDADRNLHERLDPKRVLDTRGLLRKLSA